MEWHVAPFAPLRGLLWSDGVKSHEIHQRMLQQYADTCIGKRRTLIHEEAHSDYLTQLSPMRRFDINLVNGGNEDILLHINPRFDEGSSIVRNSRLGGTWGSEERDTSSFPFEHGSHFDLVIVNEESAFQIWVNGDHLFDFAHRDNPSLANVVNVNGGIFVKRILVA